eukprot:PhF_6_TR38881/c0_g1_i4/m.58152
MTSSNDFIGSLLSGSNTFIPAGSEATPPSLRRHETLDETTRPLSPRGSGASMVPFTSGSDSIAVHILRYSLLFVNMMFVMASMLLVVAGTMVRGSSAMLICTQCRNLAFAPMILGGLLWLFALSGFYAAKRRNVTLLLVYGVYIIVLFVAILAVLITATAFSVSDTTSEASTELRESWEHLVRDEPIVTCNLLEQLLCSGYSALCNTTSFQFLHRNMPEKTCSGPKTHSKSLTV